MNDKTNPIFVINIPAAPLEDAPVAKLSVASDTPMPRMSPHTPEGAPPYLDVLNLIGERLSPEEEQKRMDDYADELFQHMQKNKGKGE